MEKSQNKNSRLAEIVIVFMLLACIALILADMTINLVNELDAGDGRTDVLEATSIPTTTPMVRPTYPPDYTPEAIIDS